MRNEALHILKSRGLAPGIPKGHWELFSTVVSGCKQSDIVFVSALFVSYLHRQARPSVLGRMFRTLGRPPLLTSYLLGCTRHAQGWLTLSGTPTADHLVPCCMSLYRQDVRFCLVLTAPRIAYLIRRSLSSLPMTGYVHAIHRRYVHAIERRYVHATETGTCMDDRACQGTCTPLTLVDV